MADYKHEKGNFFIDTIMDIGKVDRVDAEVILTVIDDQALVTSWMNGTRAEFRQAIRYAVMYIENGFSWETE